MKQRREELEKFLDNIPELLEPSVEQHDAIFALMQNKGFIALLGLLQAGRQGFYMQLANTPLHDELHRHAASVIQGQIKGIDAIRDTLLSLIPDQDPTEQEQPNG